MITYKDIKNKRPKIDLCGTLLFFVFYKPKSRLTGIISNLAITSSCQRQPRALDNPVGNAPKDFHLSVADFHFYINTIRHCFVL